MPRKMAVLLAPVGAGAGTALSERSLTIVHFLRYLVF